MILNFGMGYTLDTENVEDFETEDAFNKFNKDSETPEKSFNGVYTISNANIPNEVHKIGFREHDANGSYSPADNEVVLHFCTQPIPSAPIEFESTFDSEKKMYDKLVRTLNRPGKRARFKKRQL